MKASLAQAISEHIQEELFSAYVYLSMEAYSDFIDLPGFAHWFYLQSKVEMDQVNDLHRYLLNQDAKLEYKAIPKPPVDFDGPLHLFEMTLKHEKKVSEKLNKLYEMAMYNEDYDLQAFLKKYLDQQLEDESAVKNIIAKIKLAGNKQDKLFNLDRELAARANYLIPDIKG